MSRKTFILLASAILLGAAFLRLADLHRYPPGLHYDEAADMLLSRDVAFYGYRPFPVVTAYSGREALYYYLAAPLLRIFGTEVMATRLTSAFLGLLAVAATVALGRAMLRSRGLALLAGAWLAVSGPEVWLSRQGFRTSPQPLLEALCLWLLWVALRRTRARTWLPPAILGGVFGGLAVYIYMAARVFPPWLALALAALILVNREARGLRLRQAAVFLAALAVTAAPIGLFYLNNPDVLFDRLNQLAPSGATVTLAESLRLHLEMFFLRGDPLLRYNLYPGRPFFDVLSGLLLLVGLGAAARRFLSRGPGLERSAGAFLLLCPLLIAPSVVAVGGLPPSHMRSVAMVPLVFFLPALGALALAELIRASRPARLAAGIALFLALGALTWRDYEVWGGRIDLFYDSDGDLNLAARWLEHAAGPDTLIYISTLFYEHPTVLAHRLDPAQIRWTMDDHLFLPPPGQEAIYIFPHSVTGTPWLGWLGSGRVENVPPGPDGVPAFGAFRFRPGEMPAVALATPAEANVGGVLRLRGASLLPATAGQTAEAILGWEILRQPERDDLAPIVSLVDAWDNEIARATPYFEYSKRWLPGERLYQRVRLDIPSGNSPGDYTLKVTWIGTALPNDYLPLLDERGRFAGVWRRIGPFAVRLGSATAVTPPPDGAFLPGVYALETSPLPASLQQGERLRFTVRWLAAEPIRHDPPLRLIAEQAGRDPLTLWAGQSVHDTYPMARWSAGEQVIDRYDVPIPPDFPPGEYRLTLTTDGALRPAFSTTLNVIAVSRNFTPPDLANRPDLRLGDSITLVGYEIQTSAGKATVQLAWQALGRPDRSYTVFVHVLNPDGTIFSQQDSPPSRPTSQWIEREVITDTYTLALPAGEYRIEAGLYVQESGLRLPVTDAAGREIGDSVRLR